MDYEGIQYADKEQRELIPLDNKTIRMYSAGLQSIVMSYWKHESVFIYGLLKRSLNYLG